MIDKPAETVRGFRIVADVPEEVGQVLAITSFAGRLIVCGEGGPYELINGRLQKLSPAAGRIGNGE